MDAVKNRLKVVAINLLTILLLFVVMLCGAAVINNPHWIRIALETLFWIWAPIAFFAAIFVKG